MFKNKNVNYMTKVIINLSESECLNKYCAGGAHGAYFAKQNIEKVKPSGLDENWTFE